MTSSTDELLPPGNDDLAIVFVHGFLDDRHTWDGVVNQLVTGVETIRVDLYGCGGQADASGPFSYDRLAAEVGAVVDRLGKPFVIVGQSMGAAIAELVAADRPETARGLVLLTQCRSQGPTCRTRPSSQHPAARRGWAGAGATVGQGVAVRRVPPADRDGRRRVDTWRRLKTCCNHPLGGVLRPLPQQQPGVARRRRVREPRRSPRPPSPEAGPGQPG
jgi:pimeloyl-ACP methyl ester carboxylesterase